MKEIKFRVWNGEKMLEPYFNGCINDIFEQAKNVYLQYTGLKDVNGKEIYEGDIVKNIGPHSPTIRKYGFGEFRYINENLVVCKELVGTTLRHVVDYKFQRESPNGLSGMSPNGWYGPKPPIDNEQFWNYQRSFEVIGNIFENSEILGVSIDERD